MDNRGGWRVGTGWGKGVGRKLGIGKGARGLEERRKTSGGTSLG